MYINVCENYIENYYIKVERDKKIFCVLSTKVLTLVKKCDNNNTNVFNA